MIKLDGSIGLPIQFDYEKLVFDGSDIQCDGKVEISLENVRGELLNPALTCPDTFCTNYLHIDQKDTLKKMGLRYDVVVMPPNLAGIEYVKSKGHYNDLVTSSDSFPEIFEVLYGWAIVLLQRPRLKPAEGNKWSSVNDMFDFEHLDDVIVVRLAKGEKMVIPSGWGHVFINGRQIPLVFSLTRNDQDFKVRRFVPERGAAYYFIRKNARQEVVRNPRYKTVPKFQKGRSDFILKELGMTLKTPVFRQVVRNKSRFKWLRSPGSVNWNRMIEAVLA